MKNVIFVLMLVMCIVLFSCYSDPQSEVEVSNKGVKVELLFENDGVKVYRFHDGGRAIYYIDARGNTHWNESNGKSSYNHLAETVE